MTHLCTLPYYSYLQDHDYSINIQKEKEYEHDVTSVSNPKTSVQLEDNMRARARVPRSITLLIR